MPGKTRPTIGDMIRNLRDIAWPFEPPDAVLEFPPPCPPGMQQLAEALQKMYEDGYADGYRDAIAEKGV